jgi:hypothetical protein
MWKRMQTTTCDRCGCEVQHGEYPFCPHGFGQGMLGRFYERDVNMGEGMKHYTSLSELRKDERQHGLEPIEPHEMDRIQSHQVQARRILEERQRATQGIRERAIGEALRTVRERSR